ncbi:cytochrome D1 domain-containing protein [Actinophytocola sp. KF-1]
MSAREIPVAATVTVGHRAYFVRPRGDGYAAISAEGEVTLLDSGLGVTGRLDLGGPVDDVAVAPDGTWAWVSGGRLWIGEPGRAEDAPLPGEAACRWQPSGRALWVAEGTGDQVRVEVRDRGHRVARQVTVPDPFGTSMVAVCEHPRDDAVVLWVAAGQDGQQSWLVTDDGTDLAAALLPADDCLPALFGPDGDWFLAAGSARLARFSWPEPAELGGLTWEEIDPEAAEDGHDGPGADLVLLPGGHASWSTGNGRVRVIDVTTMSVVDEITFAGHPLRTVADLYPRLAGEENLCTDFAFSALGHGGAVVSVHGQGTLVLSALRDWAPAR